jgi:hypothetical protein
MKKSFLEQFANEIPFFDDLLFKRKFDKKTQLNVLKSDDNKLFYLSSKTICQTKKSAGGTKIDHRERL